MLNRIRSLFDSYALYASTIFASAFLLFLIQPMIGRHLLPYFGGSTAVWATSLLFFTAMLFLGYLYVYWITGRTIRTQVRLHIALIAIGTVSIASMALVRGEIYPPLDWTVDSALYPPLQVIFALLWTIGIPYFFLATTSPLLQHWYSLTTDREPYQLYAISNIGSFLALLIYPFAIEPTITNASQGILWASLFLLSAFAYIGCSLYAGKFAKHIVPRASFKDVPLKTYAVWIGLSALPAALLVSVTNEITLSISSVPFLWIIPLALYLLSFTMAFQGRASSGWVHVFAFASALIAYNFLGAAMHEVTKFLFASFAFLFFVSLYCNGQLYNLRPGKHDSSLFYLCISFGGTLGVFLVSFIAPLAFDKVWEYVLGIALCAMLVAYLYPAARYIKDEYHDSIRIARAAVLCAIFLVSGQYYLDHQEKEYIKSRNFYGTVKITDWNGERALYNGSTMHGSQFLDKDRMFSPNSYYGPVSGIGRSIAHLQRQAGKKPLSVAMIGLGTGATSVYCRNGDSYVFYEIDKRIEELARTYFSYLAYCRGSEVRIGDGRLLFEKELREGGGKKYDLVAIDAFNDDSIPTHLLTNEAFKLYAEYAKDDGLIVIHTSNRYLDLAPIAARIGEESGYASKIITDDGKGEGLTSSQWVVLSKNSKILADAPFGTSTPTTHVDVPLWTDDYINLFAALDLPPLFSWGE